MWTDRFQKQEEHNMLSISWRNLRACLHHFQSHLRKLLRDTQLLIRSDDGCISAVVSDCNMPRSL